jgi:hypothetical protein
MRGGGCGVSANEYSCAHGAQINFGIKKPGLSLHVKVKAGKPTTARTTTSGAASVQGALPHSDQKADETGSSTWP